MDSRDCNSISIRYIKFENIKYLRLQSDLRTKTDDFVIETMNSVFLFEGFSNPSTFDISFLV